MNAPIDKDSTIDTLRADLRDAGRRLAQDNRTIGNLRDQLNLRDKTILVRAARILELEAELAVACLPDEPQGNLKC